MLQLNGATSGLRANWRRGFFRLRRHRIGYHRFPVAAFLHTSAHDPDLGLLFHDERRATLRARLRQRHMWASVIAVRIPRAPIENAGTPAPALARAAPPHKFAFIAFRAFDAHGDRPRVLALRIAGATDELAEAPALLNQVVAAQRALFLERLVWLVRDARPLHQPPRRLAIWIAGTSHECAKAPALDGHFLAAVLAILGFAFTAVIGKLRRHILDKIAIRIAR